MSPITIIFTLLIVTSVLFRSISFLSRRSRKKKEGPFLQLSREGAANNLIFCSQEMLQNKVIGIDGIHRKILIVEKIKNKYNSSLISLNEVQNCKLITKYKTSEPGNELSPKAVKIFLPSNWSLNSGIVLKLLRSCFMIVLSILKESCYYLKQKQNTGA